MQKFCADFRRITMALPEKKRERNRIDEQNSRGTDAEWIEEHYTLEDSASDQPARRVHRGHDFAMDLHPGRYPRESLSRIGEGILDDDLKRHEHDGLGYTIPDLEDKIDDVRNLSRTLMFLGALLLIFAWIVTWWVGWDIRSGNTFFSSMWIVAVVIGLGLIVWGTVERQLLIRVLSRMRAPAEDRREQIDNKREFGEGDRAA
jgi:hypothetical protein